MLPTPVAEAGDPLDTNIARVAHRAVARDRRRACRRAARARSHATLAEAHRWAREAVAALAPVPEGSVKKALTRFADTIVERSSRASSSRLQEDLAGDEEQAAPGDRRRSRRHLRRHPAQGRAALRRLDRPVRPPPAPYGLVRYGVAPDHPRIKGIITALREVLDRGDIRIFGNVRFGEDITLDDLKKHYNAAIFATGAVRDASLNIPGIELEGLYGAADFVSWYDGHPDYPREWPLEAESVAVIGNGNVALDVSRILAKHAEDLLPTEIPANVYEASRSRPSPTCRVRPPRPDLGEVHPALEAARSSASCATST